MLKNKKLLISIIILIIIAAGVGIFITMGFNYDLYYSANTQIDITIDTSNISIDEIKEIANSVFENKNNVQISNGEISIMTKEISEDQKNEIVNKLNEKYALELTTAEVVENKNAQVNQIDIVYPYISPVIISTVVVLMYFAIKFRKKEWIKKVCIALGSLILIQLLAVSIILITRLPIGNLTMPILLTIYILNILVISYMFEKK